MQISLQREKGESLEQKGKILQFYLAMTFITCVFHRKHKLQKHKRLHAEENTTTCKICGETFNNRLMLLIHKNKHNAQNMSIVVKQKLPSPK